MLVKFTTMRRERISAGLGKVEYGDWIAYDQVWINPNFISSVRPYTEKITNIIMSHDRGDFIVSGDVEEVAARLHRGY